MKEHRFDPYDPKSMFNALVPRQFQKEMLNVVVCQYDAAYVHCHERFGASTCADLLPHYRRAMIEDGLSELAERFEGHACRSQLNAAHNCSHNVLFLGARILLTQSKAETRSTLPREAHFRGSYARDAQGVFEFAVDESCNVNSDTSELLYAMVVHCPSEIPRIPLFVDIVFPDTGYRQVVDSILLREAFPDVRCTGEPSEEPIVPEIDQKLRLKRGSKREDTA